MSDTQRANTKRAGEAAGSWEVLPSHGMTRAEAIDHIIGIELTFENDRCVGDDKEAMEEMRVALRALGVTDEEMDA